MRGEPDPQADALRQRGAALAAHARRWLAERRRRMTREPHRVHYFHQPDDPYSHLAAQVLGRLVERYEVVLEVHLVEPPSEVAAPEPERLASFSCKDAADVAPAYGLAFPEKPAPLAADAVARAAQLLAPRNPLFTH